jgi:hypothetical protein
MIDWQNHDGVNIPMINDYVRNQFYESVISKNVRGKKVVDIGFGTGLLSILCLKHGATSIVAFEDNVERYELGLEIIKKCALENKIQLINHRYNWQTNIDADVIVTETVNGDLWQEGLWQSLPRVNDILFLPGEYFVELYVKEIPKSFAEMIDYDTKSESFFMPGVDLDDRFVDTINQYVCEWHNKTYSGMPTVNTVEDIHYFDNRIDGPWGFIPFMRLVDSEKYLKQSILIDANNTQDINFDATHLETTLEVDPKQYSIVVPRYGMQHDDDKLYLDTGHWGPTQDAVIVNGKEQVTFRHSVKNGTIQYV